MENPRADELHRLSVRFDLDNPYCSMTEMLSGIRQIEQLPAGTAVSGSQRRALLENLRRVLTRTAAAPDARASLAAQSTLYRWHFLRAADEAAADAYAAVLIWFEIEVPECLLPGPP